MEELNKTMDKREKIASLLLQYEGQRYANKSIDTGHNMENRYNYKKFIELVDQFIADLEK